MCLLPTFLVQAIHVTVAPLLCSLLRSPQLHLAPHESQDNVAYGLCSSLLGSEFQRL